MHGFEFVSIEMLAREQDCQIEQPCQDNSPLACSEIFRDCKIDTSNEYWECYRQLVNVSHESHRKEDIP